MDRAATLRAQAGVSIPEDAPYSSFTTLSSEARQKLARIRPGSLAQAGRIPGVSPADLQNLVMELRRMRAEPPGRPPGASGDSHRSKRGRVSPAQDSGAPRAPNTVG